jgi:hypothetical protein
MNPSPLNGFVLVSPALRAAGSGGRAPEGRVRQDSNRDILSGLSTSNLDIILWSAHSASDREPGYQTVLYIFLLQMMISCSSLVPLQPLDLGVAPPKVEFGKIGSNQWVAHGPCKGRPRATLGFVEST